MDSYGLLIYYIPKSDFQNDIQLQLQVCIHFDTTHGFVWK